ncbi:hypothetical protein NKG94_34370 [Micromonospora sp. M12]
MTIYRLHIYDGDYEVLHKRTYTLNVDLDGPGVDGLLDRQLQALTREARAANEPMDSPRLEVRDARTGAKMLDWTGPDADPDPGGGPVAEPKRTSASEPQRNPGSGNGADLILHTMSPTAVAVLLLLALVVDYMSVGPNSLRDRLAFLLAVPAVREGFNDSPLDKWTVGAATGAIEKLLDTTGGAYIAGASVNAVLGPLSGCWSFTQSGAYCRSRPARNWADSRR